MKKARIALFLLAAVGLVASILLTQLHYKAEKKGFEEKSFCNISEFIDCDTVVASRYSAVKTPYLTIPNSELGVLYYLLILLGLLYVTWSGEARKGRDVHRGTLGFLFLSLVFANVYSVVMAYISLRMLGVICAICFATYVVNALLLLFFPLAMGLRYAEVPSFLGRYVASVFGASGGGVKPRLGLHLGLTLGLFAFGLFFFFGLNPPAHRPHPPIPRDLYLKSFESIPVQEIDVMGRPFWGNPNAKVRLVAFSDFQCPFCRRAAFTLKSYLKAYQEDVVFYFLNYPLDPTCNPAIPPPGHPVACLAAKAAVCAGKEGKFWDYHDLIFVNQGRLSRAVLVELAANAGLNGPTFESCLASDEALEAVKRDVEEGGKVQLQGTPTLYINGRFFRDWPDPDRLRMVIEAEREK